MFFSIQRNYYLCRILFNNTIIFGLIFFKSTIATMENDLPYKIVLVDNKSINQWLIGRMGCFQHIISNMSNIRNSKSA